MNADKTECMILNKGKVTPPMSSQAYVQKITGISMTCQEIGLEKVTCDQSRTQVCRKQLQQHQGKAKCNDLQNQCTPPNTMTATTTTLASPVLMDMNKNVVQ
jgi:hypothetical protein